MKPWELPWDDPETPQEAPQDAKPWELYGEGASPVDAYRERVREALALDDYGDMLVILESGGDPTAQAPTSSAAGLAQFTKDTWLQTVKKAQPAWAEGLDQESLLQARLDPDRSLEMERTLREENAFALSVAEVEPSHINLYAAHHFGAKKGIKFAKAAPDTPMAKILTPQQLSANAYLKYFTKQETIDNWAERTKRPWLKY